MSLEHIKGELVFVCDGCDDALETGEGEFGSALAKLKKEGWIAEKSGHTWNHFCLDCQK